MKYENYYNKSMAVFPKSNTKRYFLPLLTAENFFWVGWAEVDYIAELAFGVSLYKSMSLKLVLYMKYDRSDFEMESLLFVYFTII